MNWERYSGHSDLVSQFRLMEPGEPRNAYKDQIENYLENTTKLTRKDITEDLIARAEEVEEEEPAYQVRRLGKDADDIFWAFGKVHGLENIAFASEQELARISDPVELQRLLNDVERPDTPALSFDHLISNMRETALQYKAEVDKLHLYTSDRQKLLALPFYLSKRSENSEPKKGQWQYEFFKELTGFNWHDDEGVERDEEKKITEFDYENFFPAEQLKVLDTKSEEFKKKVRWMNLTTETKYETLQRKKQEYRELMKYLALLNEEEGRALVHHLNNRRNVDREIIFEACDTTLLERMAKLSEEGKFALKNRWRLEKQNLNFQDKSRVAVDRAKFKDVLKNQGEFRHHFD